MGKYEKLKQQLIEKDQELNNICQHYDFQLNEFSREIYRLKQREKILEQQLANSIRPKFKIGQEVYYVYNKYQKFPFKCVIDKMVYDSSKNYKFRYDTSDGYYICVKEEELFATYEEAQAKLEELQGEKIVLTLLEQIKALLK